MIGVRVLDVKPHPDQASNNPGCWAVRFEVWHNGAKRSFWRWHNVREDVDGRYVTPSNRKPHTDEIIERFWDDTFAELHGFSFNKDDP